MSNNDNKQPPEPTDSLPVATGGTITSHLPTIICFIFIITSAGLTMEDIVGHVNALESQLKAIGGQDSDFLKNLKPAVRKRVEVLRGIQSEHDELDAKFFEEKAKYQNLYAPLYSKRYDIVTGAVEVDGEKEEDAMDQTDDTEKGVPEFWLTAMKHNKITAEKITERDEEALKYLKDIKWCHMDDPEGFKLEFFFDTNPFFTNSVLTKVYHMRSYFNKHILEKAIGTTIEWLPGKCLTQMILEMKPKKGSKNAKPITKTQDCASFFNFFSPPEEKGHLMKEDYYVGLSIRDKIIPHGVSWFTGEAIPTRGRKISVLLGGYYDEDDEDYVNGYLFLVGASYDKHPAYVKNFGIPDIKTRVAQRFPSQLVQDSITGVKPGKKNDSLDIPASSKNG